MPAKFLNSLSRKKYTQLPLPTVKTENNLILVRVILAARSFAPHDVGDARLSGPVGRRTRRAYARKEYIDNKFRQSNILQYKQPDMTT